MSLYQKKILLVCLVLSMVTFSGCSLLKLPFQLLNAVFQILDKIPRPPPGVLPPPYGWL